MTRDQLGRRYNLIFGTLQTGRCLNSAKVARWYGKQDVDTRSTLERTEPFTWLKHLAKRDNKFSDRSHWFISALIAEEYMRTNSRHDLVTMIPEHGPLRKGFYEPPASPSFIHSAPVTARISIHDIPDRPHVRKSHSEDRLTFQPRVNSSHPSLEIDTHTSHESSFSSLPVGSSLTRPASAAQGHEVPSQLIATSLHLPGNQSLDHSRLDGSDHGDLRNHESPITNPDVNIKVVGASDASDEVPSGEGVTLQLTAPLPLNENVSKSQTAISPTRSRPAVSSRLRTRVSPPFPDRKLKSSEVQQREDDEQKTYDTKVR